MSKITILGAGSWGTALSVMLGKMKHEVLMWSPDHKEVMMINMVHEHRNKLPEVRVPSGVRATESMEEALKEPDIIIFAVPSLYARDTAILMKPHIKRNSVVLNVAKGIEESSLKTMTKVIGMEVEGLKLCTMSGPSHAEEVARGIPTTCVVAGVDKDVVEFVQDTLMNQKFRIYTSSDLIGVELGGSLKNVIAVAAGIADGLGGGDNTRAALITRGMAEIARLGIKMGGRVETFYGLSGIGDLIVTCGSKLSRNYKAGRMIGEGKSLSKTLEQIGMVVEGVNSAKAILKLAKRNAVEMPIVNEVNSVLFYNKPPMDAMHALMTRGKKTETGFMPW